MGLKRKIEDLEVLFRYGFRVKPRLWLRTIIGYLKALFSGPPPLHYVDFVTDYTCNLRCQHCFATSLVSSQREKLTIEKYKMVAKEAMALGVIHFSFQGGEPLLDQRLPEIIKAFKPSANYISVTTNGSLLTQKKILNLKKLGVDKLSISLDSGIAKEHDQFRGVPGTSKKAWRGMAMALKSGLKVTINTTVSHQNLHSGGLKKLFAWAMKKKVIINPIFACPLGRWTGNLNILLTVGDRKQIDGLRKRSAYIRRDMDSNWFRFGCGAVKEVLYITPYGDVMPCPFLHISLGNVQEESLSRIRARGLKEEVFREYHSTCLASENRSFMKRYFSVIGGKKLPAKLEEVRECLKT